MKRNDNDFFVGYLRMSPRLRLSTALIAAGILVTLLVAGTAWAMRHGDPGATLQPIGDQPVTTGLYRARPYPHVVHRDSQGHIATLLLVGGGKGGPRVGEIRDGEGVSVSGTLLMRDGTRIIESPDLEPTDLAPDLAEALATTRPESQTVTLTGEIVDSKCYFGRMRPGGGRVHRACAQICIEGGVPPILVVRNADGREQHVVLASEDGGLATGLVLPFVAEPVRVTGQLTRVSGIDWLHLAPNGIERY